MTDVVVHENLEDITIYMNTPGSCSSILMLQPLMLKIKSGNLPYLQRIILYGNFPEGCLDGHQMLSPDVYKLWEDALDCFFDQGVEIVSHLGHSIHLWRRRHGIIPEGSDGGGSSSSDEEELRERGGTSALGDGDGIVSDSQETNESDLDSDSSESEVGSERELISDDPEDDPYRYVHQSDIDSDSDDEEML